MNVYQGGKNVFIAVGDVIYWLQFAPANVPPMGFDPTAIELTTGTVLDSELTSAGGLRVIRVAEGSSHTFSMRISNDRAGYDSFANTISQYAAREGATSSLRKYSAIHESGADNIEVHCYKKDIPRQFNGRPNLDCTRDEFLEWCL